ncbi:hypothetical protein MWU31_21915 [Aeromonas hydrophila]|uniref:hypothetical protein n=1 Tax=Aeromonas hydrophila TaxID=644 RepID=UPI001FF25998|nr:hypothetical protein [Aeromonas hydrophila]MCK0187883.1 hypothetical protein [Aeromonas hydrophila]UOV94563.1 hypothetical protein MUW98_24365 [Aeromonas hydrophila]
MRTELAQQFQQIEAVAQQLVKMLNGLSMTSQTLEDATAEEKLALLLISQQRAPAMSLFSSLGAINEAANNLRQE